MKKIKPKFPKLREKTQNFYSFQNWTRRKKKTNMICPNKNCSYSSRVFVWGPNHVDCNESIHCPIHRGTLINIGDVARLPKKGSKERMKLIEKFKKINQ